MCDERCLKAIWAEVPKVHTSCDLTSRRLCKHAISISARRSKSLSSSLTGPSFAPFFFGPLLPFCFGGICAEAAAAEAEAECCTNDCKAYAWHDKLKSLKYFGKPGTDNRCPGESSSFKLLYCHGGCGYCYWQRQNPFCTDMASE